MQLTVDQIDALREVVNIGVGQSAGMLNEMIEYRIILQVPSLKLFTLPQLEAELYQQLGTDRLASVKLNFSGSFSGNAQLIFPSGSAAILVALLVGEQVESPMLDALRISTLSEIENIVLNGVMGSISNILVQPLKYEVPIFLEANVKELLRNEENDQDILLTKAHFHVEELQLQGDIVLFFGVGSIEAMLAAIECIA